MVIQRCVQLRIMQNHRSLFSDSNGNYFLSGASSGAEEQEAAQGGLVSAEETRVHRHGAAADADASSGGDVGGATRSTSDGTDGVGLHAKTVRETFKCGTKNIVRSTMASHRTVHKKVHKSGTQKYSSRYTKIVFLQKHT